MATKDITFETILDWMQAKVIGLRGEVRQLALKVFMWRKIRVTGEEQAGVGFDNGFFDGEAGSGKTHLMEVYAEALQEFADFRHVVKLKPGGTPIQVLGQISGALQYCTSAVFILDEAQETSRNKALCNALKLVMEAGKSGRVELRFPVGRKGEIALNYGTKDVLFIGATNEPAIDPALKRRLSSGFTINVPTYSRNVTTDANGKAQPSEMQQLFEHFARVENLSVTPLDAARDILLDRCFPLASSVRTLCKVLKADSVRSTKDAKEFCLVYKYFPKGLRSEHIAVIQFLAKSIENGAYIPRQVQEIAAGIGKLPEDAKKIVAQCNLVGPTMIVTDRGGKMLGEDGKAYLELLKPAKAKPKGDAPKDKPKDTPKGDDKGDDKAQALAKLAAHEKRMASLDK